ncbi:MAG: hypothetical protein DRP64_03100, partial [Verrucomicrobia bacterium]
MKTLNPITKTNEPRNTQNTRKPALPYHSGFVCFVSFVVKISLVFLACTGTALAADTDVADSVKRKLYWPDATTAEEQETAAFRYKALLYTNETGGVRANAENMGNLYGAAERTRAQTAENELRAGLLQYPGSTLLQNLLLDIHYDRTAAELVLAGNMQIPDGRTVDRMRMGPPTVVTGLVIDDE